MNQWLTDNLRSLLEMVSKYEEISRLVSEREERLEKLETTTPNLDAFDREYKPAFLADYVGQPPKDVPTIGKVGMGIGFFPALITQTQVQKHRERNYAKRESEAESIYEERYKTEREERAELDKKYREEETKRISSELMLLLGQQKELKNNIAQNTVIADKFKTSDILQKFLSYVEEGRANDIKEVINIYYDERYKEEEAQKSEEFRKKAIEMIEDYQLTMEMRLDEIEEQIGDYNDMLDLEELSHQSEELKNNLDDLNKAINK